MEKKESYMHQVIALAKNGEGKTSPNPMAGCIVVKDGRIIAEGFHKQHGKHHAERDALQNCIEDPQGAELYVNLEPCCHQGQTPPCTEIIIEKGIKKVYVGCVDPNPLMAGKGVEELRKHGIEVETGVLEAESQRLNEVFFHYMNFHMPFVAMKYAMTLDGKIASETGDSKWVTGTQAREEVKRLRNRYRGIMVGIGTVLTDDPMLNCRLKGGRNPVRIICDSGLKIPLNSKIVQTASEIETVAAYHQGEIGKEKKLRDLGVQLLKVPMAKSGKNPGLDMKKLLKKIADMGIDSILLEGGGTLNASMLEAHQVQRVYAFLAPKLIAGADAKSPVEGIGIKQMKKAVTVHNMEIEHYGADICITGEIKNQAGKG